MKVISGIYKGRILEGFTIDGTRPTMDRVKESLFAMLQNYMTGSVVLDLFSGSGNLGIEALSEGASYAYLVDSNRKATKVIENNINKLDINNCKIMTIDYLKSLDILKEDNIKLDIIFLDPPYKTNYISKAIERIMKLDLLNDKGIIVCETDSLDKIKILEKLSSIKEKKYGDKYIVLLQKM